MIDARCKFEAADMFFSPFAAISEATGMDPHDIAATLQQLNFVQLKNGRYAI